MHGVAAFKTTGPQAITNHVMWWFRHERGCIAGARNCIAGVLCSGRHAERGGVQVPKLHNEKTPCP